MLRSSSELRRWSPALALVVAVGLVYSNAFHGAWLFDDEFLILRNRFLDSFAHLGDIFGSSSTGGAGFRDLFYRPLQGLAYLILTQMFGREVTAFHALNIGLHALNTLLVWTLGRRLGLSDRAAFAGALLWGVHPVHVEAVSYVSATADPLHAGLVLLALNLIAPPSTRVRRSLGLFVFALALLAKESAVVLPGLFTAVIFLRERAPFNLRPYAKTLPFWAVSVLYVLARKFWFVNERGLSFFAGADPYADHLFTRVWTALATLPSYLELLLWPHDLHMDRDFPAFTSPWMSDVLGSLVMVALALVIAVAALRRPTPGRRFALFAVAWVIAAHAPHSGILMPVNSVFLEHWLYLTSVAPLLAVGRMISGVRAPVGWLAALILPAVALGQKTYRQNEIWSTPIRFFTHTLGYSPKSARIRHNLALALLADGQTDRALEQLELMIAAGTPYPATYHTAGHAYLERRQLDRAEPLFLKALALDPKFYPSLQDLVVLCAMRGDRTRGEEFARRLHDVRPDL